MGALNVGNIDRAIRMLLGLMLMALSYAGVIGSWGYAGIVLVLTGAIALCPLYSLLGLRTTAR